MSNPDSQLRPEVRAEDAYGAYRQAGGILSAEHYQHAVDFLQDGINSGGGTPSRGQAVHMAAFAGLELSPIEESLYCYWREQNHSPPSDGIDRGAEEPGGQVPRQFSDQMLLAEVLFLSRGSASVDQFKSKYPNIFLPKPEPRSSE